MDTTTIQIIAQTFLWIAVLSGTAILVPQVVRMHKNKYADNSSIGLYIFYLGCNIIWTVYQILYIVTTKEEDPLQKAMLWIQFGGDILQVAFGAYSLILKIFYMVKAKHKKDNSIWVILKRRAEIALFLTKEKNPMHEVFNQLLEQYPKLSPMIHKEAKKYRMDFTRFINSRNAVELAVYNACFFKKIIDKKFNQLDVNIDKTYEKYSEYVVHKIDQLSYKYGDIINSLYNYHVKKVPFYKSRKTPKTKQDLDAYMTMLNLVDKWSFLSQIYQSLLSV